jgi:hypothetical protein
MLSLYGWAPRFHGDLSLDGFGQGTDGAPQGAGFGIAGEVRPPGWFASLDFGWGLFKDDLGLEDVHPDFVGADVDYTFHYIELAAGPCIYELPAEGPEPGRRVRGPSRLRIDPYLGVRANQLTIDSDFNPDLPGDAIDEVWVDPIAGLRVEVRPLPGLALRARGDAGGFGVGAKRDWRATAAASLRLGEGAWLSAGWNFHAIDYERSDEFTFHTRLDGPFLSIDFWF